MFGCLPGMDAAFVSGFGGFYQVDDAVPSGTTISVYSSDGSTLLYTYTTTAFNGPTVISTGGYMNTGYEPFIQQPIYVGYQQTAVGTAVFVS